MLVTGPQLLSPYLINAQTQLFSQYLHNPSPLWGPPSSSCSPGHKALVSLSVPGNKPSPRLYWQDWEVGKDSAETSLLELGPWREAVRAKSPLLCPERTGLDFLSGSVSLRTERGILQHTLAAGCAANGQGWLCSNLQLPTQLFTHGVSLNLDPSPAKRCYS